MSNVTPGSAATAEVTIALTVETDSTAPTTADVAATPTATAATADGTQPKEKEKRVSQHWRTDTRTDEEKALAGERPKLKKVKYAVFLGYSGENYYGLQHNYDDRYPSVETHLLKALYDAGMISEANYQGKVTEKIYWQRASRTDRGVHALRNLISGKLLAQPEGDEATVDKINSFLPKDIRVYALQPVTASFNSHLYCTGRRYEYYLPTFALLPPATMAELLPASVAPACPSSEELEQVKDTEKSDEGDRGEEGANQNQGRGGKGGQGKKDKRPRDGEAGAASTSNAHEDSAAPVEKAQKTEEATTAAATSASAPTTTEETKEEAATTKPKPLRPSVYHTFRSVPDSVMAALRRHRLSQETLDTVRGLFGLYCGTQSFHNFTPGGVAGQARMSRFVQAVTVSDPFIVRLHKPSGRAVEIHRKPSAADADAPVVAPDVVAPSLSEGGTGVPPPSRGATRNAAKFEELELDWSTVPSEWAEADCVDTEMVRVELCGQSFMLNQIRKMIGAVLAIVAGGLDGGFLRSLLDTAVTRHIPMAPANGLFLVALFFERYNHSLHRIQNEGKGSATDKTPIDLDAVHPDRVAEVRREVVSCIARNDVGEEITGKWMRSLRMTAKIGFGVDMP